MKTNKATQAIRYSHQGDVQFIYVDELPKSAKPIQKKPVALGEQSGHQHVFTGGEYELFESETPGRFFVKTGEKPVYLQHIHESHFKGWDMNLTQKADHGPIVVEPNSILEVGIHRRFDPFAETWVNSRD